MFSSGRSASVTVAKLLTYAAAQHIAYIGSLALLSHSACRQVVGVLSLWWAGLYVAAIIGLTWRESSLVLFAAAVYLLVYQLVTGRAPWGDQWLASFLVLVAQAAFVTSPVAVHRVLAATGRGIVSKAQRRRA